MIIFRKDIMLMNNGKQHIFKQDAIVSLAPDIEKWLISQGFAIPHKMLTFKGG